MKERVLVRKVTDLARDVAEALDFLEQDFKGLRIWVKPNLLAAARPEQGVNTNPKLVRQVVRQLKTRGAAQVWVSDNPGMSLSGSVAAYLAPTGVVEASEGSFRSPADNPVPMPLKSRFVTETGLGSDARGRPAPESAGLEDPWSDPDDRRGQEYVRPGGRRSEVPASRYLPGY